MLPWSISFLMNEHMHTKEWHFTRSWLPWSWKCHVETEKSIYWATTCIWGTEKVSNCGQSNQKVKKLCPENQETIHFLTIMLPVENFILWFSSPTSFYFIEILRSYSWQVRGSFSEDQEVKERKDKSWLMFKLYLQYCIARNEEQNGEQKPEMRIFKKNFRKYNITYTLIATI